jgi:hypothetical protein
MNCLPVSSPVHAALADLARSGWTCQLGPDTLLGISQAGFHRTTLKPILVLAQIVEQLAPITVRGAFYRAVSAGVYPDTADAHYRQCGRLLLLLRRKGILAYDGIVDSTRRRLNPSSWSGLADFGDTVAQAYRLDLWQRQRDYIEFFVEKDAMAAVIEPATANYDVHLNIIRGCVSESFVWSVAEQWKRIRKPIFAYYLGDHDPSGLMIEADLQSRLREFAPEAELQWQRIAIDEADFADASNLGFPIKGTRTTRAWKTKHSEYLARYGDRCVEVDALDPLVIRGQVMATIEGHIDQGEWTRLKEIEGHERETVRTAVVKMGLAPQINGREEA